MSGLTESTTELTVRRYCDCTGHRHWLPHGQVQLGVHDSARIRPEQAILCRPGQREPLSCPRRELTEQFEIQLREYAAIAAAQKSVTGIPPSMGMHKRVWDGEGEISDRPAPGRKRALSMDGDVNME